jgi:hypothetical protein
MDVDPMVLPQTMWLVKNHVFFRHKYAADSDKRAEFLAIRLSLDGL